MKCFITLFYDWSRIVTALLAWVGPLLVRLVVGCVVLWTGWKELQILPRFEEISSFVMFAWLGIAGPGPGPKERPPADYGA